MASSEDGVRDRDADGRARSARPRDALGRPLPHGAVGEERAPEGVVRIPVESLALAQSLLDAGRPFAAHEVLEDAWKAAPDAERELWRGLAQLAVGLTHALRGNVRGAVALLDRGARNLEPYAAAPLHGIAAAPLHGVAAAPLHGIDVGSLRAWARATAAAVTEGRASDVPPPRLRR